MSDNRSALIKFADKLKAVRFIDPHGPFVRFPYFFTHAFTASRRKAAQPGVTLS